MTQKQILALSISVSLFAFVSVVFGGVGVHAANEAPELGVYLESQVEVGDYLSYNKFAPGPSYAEVLSKNGPEGRSMDAPSREDITLRVKEAWGRGQIFPKTIKRIEARINGRNYSTNPTNENTSPMEVDWRVVGKAPATGYCRTEEDKKARRVFQGTPDLNVKLGACDFLLLTLQPEYNKYFPGGTFTFYYSDNTSETKTVGTSVYPYKKSVTVVEGAPDMVSEEFKPGVGNAGKAEDWHFRIDIPTDAIQKEVESISVTNDNMLTSYGATGCYTDRRSRTKGDRAYPLYVKATDFRSPTSHDDNISLDLKRTVENNVATKPIDLYCQKDAGVLDLLTTDPSKAPAIYVNSDGIYYSTSRRKYWHKNDIESFLITTPQFVSIDGGESVFAVGDTVRISFQKALLKAYAALYEKSEVYISNAKVPGKLAVLYEDTQANASNKTEALEWKVPASIVADVVKKAGTAALTQFAVTLVVYDANGAHTIQIPIVVLNSKQDVVAAGSTVQVSDQKTLTVLPWKAPATVGPGSMFAFDIPYRDASLIYSANVDFVNAAGKIVFSVPAYYTSSVDSTYAAANAYVPSTLPAGEYSAWVTFSTLGKKVYAKAGPGVVQDGLARSKVGTLYVGQKGARTSIELFPLATPTAPLTAGENFSLELTFANGPTAVPQRVFIHALDKNGDLKWKGDLEPVDRTIQWVDGVARKVRVPGLIPATVAPGEYTITAGLYSNNQAILLSENTKLQKDRYNRYVVGKITVVAGKNITPATPTTSTTPTTPAVTTPVVPSAPTILAWSSAVNTRAFTGDMFNYSVNFQNGSTKTPQRVFVHFLDSTGEMIFKNDVAPAFPTDKWGTGSVSVPITLSIPATAKPGTYEVYAGLYTSGSQVALPLVAGSGVLRDHLNRYRIGTITVIALTTTPTVPVTPTAPAVTVPAVTVPVTQPVAVPVQTAPVTQPVTTTPAPTTPAPVTTPTAPATQVVDGPIVVTPSSAKPGSVITVKIKSANGGFDVNDFFLGQYGFDASGFKVVDNQTVQLTVPAGVSVGTYDLGWFGPVDVVQTKFTVTSPVTERSVFVAAVLNAVFTVFGLSSLVR